MCKIKVDEVLNEIPEILQISASTKAGQTTSLYIPVLNLNFLEF